MAYPKEQMREKQKEATTLEGRLAKKFDDLQMAREYRDPNAFDEIGRSIEVLFKAIPKAYEELMEEKEDLGTELEEVFADIQERADGANDIITKETMLSNQSYQAQWAYRESYEELIIEKLQKFDLIPINNPKYASIESDGTVAVEEPEEDKEVVEVEEVEEELKPKKKPKMKPKLSVKRKVSNDDTDFDI